MEYQEQLCMRHTGRVVHGTNPGPQPYLNKAEEAELRDFVVIVGQIGYEKTQRQIEDIAEAVACDKGILKKEKISDGWLRRFLERQPSLSLQKGASTATACMEAMADRGAIENYFKLLKEVLDEHALLEKPAQIYNVDESGIPVDHRPPHVVVKNDQRKVHYCTAGNKNQVTVIGCINAAGSALTSICYF